MDRDGSTPATNDDRYNRLGLEPGDYYFTPEGYLVFTERYHLRRGYCCGNKCKHCPFGHEAVSPGSPKRQPG